MNEDVVTVVADQLALMRLHPEPTTTDVVLARDIVRAVRRSGWTFTRSPIQSCNTQPKETVQ